LPLIGAEWRIEVEQELQLRRQHCREEARWDR
jgi:hypothetical protein